MRVFKPQVVRGPGNGQSEARARELEQVLEQTGEAVLVKDLDAVVTYWNREAASLYGFSAQEAVGQPLRKLHAADLSDADYARILDRIRAGSPTSTFTDRCKKSGEIVRVALKTTPLLDAEGKRVGEITVARDITALHRMDEALRAERKEAELARSQLFHALVAAIAATSAARDAYTAGHQRRVAQISVAIATEIGLDADAIEGIRVAAEIHDLGKISIPAEILSCPTKLRAVEFELVKNHPRAGYEIVCNIPFPWPVADMILQHPERLDGSGYPSGIRGHQILIGARIIAVADVVEAMASHRPYRPAKGIQAALEAIERGRGTLYAPDVADACLRLARQGQLRLDEPG